MFAACIKLVLNAMVGVIYLFDKIPFAYIYISNISIWGIILYYVFIIMGFYGPWRTLGSKMNQIWLKLKKGPDPFLKKGQAPF